MRSLMRGSLMVVLLCLVGVTSAAEP